MAAVFWVGGTGVWDASTTTNWSTTSGGTGGAPVPTSVDDVTFDSNSGAAATVTINGGGVANSITINKSDLTLTHATGSTVTGAVTLTIGTLSTNGKPCSWGRIVGTGASSRTLTLGASVITLTGATGPQWSFGTTTGLVFNCGTSTIVLNGAAQNFSGGGLTYNAVSFTGGGACTMQGANTFASFSCKGDGTGSLNITGSNTYGMLDLECSTVARTITLIASGTQTVTGTCTLQGASGQSLSLVSSSPGTPTTLTVKGVVSRSNVSLSGDIVLNTNSAQFGVSAALAVLDLLRR